MTVLLPVNIYAERARISHFTEWIITLNRFNLWTESIQHCIPDSQCRAIRYEHPRLAVLSWILRLPRVYLTYIYLTAGDTVDRCRL